MFVFDKFYYILYFQFFTSQITLSLYFLFIPFTYLKYYIYIAQIMLFSCSDSSHNLTHMSMYCFVHFPFLLFILLLLSSKVLERVSSAL